MSTVTATRAEVVDLGEYPSGSDADIMVAMVPAEDTTGWGITVDFSETRDGDVVLSLTTADAEVTVGEGDDGERIRIKMASADTELTGRHWMHVRRTDTGERDRYVLATIKFRGPSVA